MVPYGILNEELCTEWSVVPCSVAPFISDVHVLGGGVILSVGKTVLHRTTGLNNASYLHYLHSRIFSSNLKERMAQRFYNLVLLPRVRDDIAEYKRLNFHLYSALKKALFKPGAWFKGENETFFIYNTKEPLALWVPQPAVEVKSYLQDCLRLTFTQLFLFFPFCNYCRVSQLCQHVYCSSVRWLHRCWCKTICSRLTRTEPQSYFGLFHSICSNGRSPQLDSLSVFLDLTSYLGYHGYVQRVFVFLCKNKHDISKSCELYSARLYFWTSTKLCHQVRSDSSID